MTASEQTKQPFEIDAALRRIGEAITPYPPAALFGLAAAGFDSLFQQLVACIISIRTRDEQTAVIAPRLFRRAPTPARILELSEQEIVALIRPSSFAEGKAPQIRAIARRAEEQGGELPCDPQLLLNLPGVGPKCANLALGIACGLPRISVDIHVHRVTNRWGYVTTRTPEQTLTALEAKLPQRYWIAINSLLVPFGKHICTGTLPHCSTCPVLSMCRQVGVTEHR